MRREALVLERSVYGAVSEGPLRALRCAVTSALDDAIVEPLDVENLTDAL